MIAFDDLLKLHKQFNGKLNLESKPDFIPLHMPMIDPMKIRLEMVMSKGLDIIVPDFVFPKLEVEPFTKQEWADICGHKPQPNISKLRSIIRKDKQHEPCRK